ALVTGDRRGVDDDAAPAFLVERVLPGDGGSSQAHDVERRGQVGLDGLGEGVERHRAAVLADESPTACRTAVAVHGNAEGREGFGFGDGGRDGLFAAGVGVDVAHAEFAFELFARLVVDVGDDDLRAGLVE